MGVTMAHIRSRAVPVENDQILLLVLQLCKIEMASKEKDVGNMGLGWARPLHSSTTLSFMLASRTASLCSVRL